MNTSTSLTKISDTDLVNDEVDVLCWTTRKICIGRGGTVGRNWVRRGDNFNIETGTEGLEV